MNKIFLIEYDGEEKAFTSKEKYEEYMKTIEKTGIVQTREIELNPDIPTLYKYVCVYGPLLEPLEAGEISYDKCRDNPDLPMTTFFKLSKDKPNIDIEYSLEKVKEEDNSDTFDYCVIVPLTDESDSDITEICNEIYTSIMGRSSKYLYDDANSITSHVSIVSAPSLLPEEDAKYLSTLLYNNLQFMEYPDRGITSKFVLRVSSNSEINDKIEKIMTETMPNENVFELVHFRRDEEKLDGRVSHISCSLDGYTIAPTYISLTFRSKRSQYSGIGTTLEEVLELYEPNKQTQQNLFE